MAPQSRRVTRSQSKPQESSPTPPPKPKAAAPATPPPSTTKTKSKAKSASSPKGSKPTGVKKQSGRAPKKTAKTQTHTPPDTYPKDSMDVPVFLNVEHMDQGTVGSENLDRKDLVFEKSEISGEELEQFRQLGRSNRSEDHEEEKPTWNRPFHLSIRNDRLAASTRWDYRHFEAAWKSLSAKIAGLAACFVKELPEGSYKDTVGPDLDCVLSELCHKPADYYDDTESLGKQWLVEAFLWSKVQWDVLKPSYTGSVDDDPWSNFIDTLARLRQYAEKPSLFSQTMQLWSSKSAMMLYALHGKRPSHVAKHAIKEWLTYWWAQFYEIDDPESDSESTDGPWSETTQAMLVQVAEQIRSVEVLTYGLEYHVRLVSQAPGHPFSKPPCECVNLTGNESSGSARIDLWVQPGLEIFPVRYDDESMKHVTLDTARGKPLHSLAARVATGPPGSGKKRRTANK